MMLATTRHLVRRAAMATANATTNVGVTVSSATTASTAARCPSRSIGFQSKAALMATRGFSTLPTDDAGDEEPHNESNDEPSPIEADETATGASNVPSSELNKNLKPSEIVEALDRHIVGQPEAKKSVAIAMRNRWRRRQLPEDLRKEVTPRNVLLVGPTG